MVLLAVLLAGACGSKQATPVAAPTTAEGGIRVDPSRCDPRGKQVVTADVDGDKRADVTKLYEVRGSGDSKTQLLTCKQSDLNRDGKIDIVTHYDPTGAISFEEFDIDFDGRFESRSYFQGGVKIRAEKDMDYDGRFDYTEIFEGGKKVRVELDKNRDGRIDEWEYYEGEKLDRIGYDTTGQGRPDKWDRAPDAVEPGAGPSAAETPAATPSASGTAPPPPPPPAPPGPVPTSAVTPAKK